MRSSILRLNTPVTPTSPVKPVEKPVVSQPSGASAALEYTGLSWLTKRRKLPSRNWLIFWGALSSLGYLYWDDRRQCKKIRNEYVERVRHLAEVPLAKSLDSPRLVHVYSCKWPGDEEYDRSLKFFKKYVKPVFVAAAVDYIPKNGNFHGVVSGLIRDRAKNERREILGIPTPEKKSFLPPKTDEDRRKERERHLQGGTVLIGRHTFKEYMHGLQAGWTESLEPVDEDERLASILQDDGKFDEPEEQSLSAGLEPNEDDAPAPPPRQRSVFTPPPPPKPATSPFAAFGSIRQSPKIRTLVPAPAPPSMSEYLNSVPESIPPQPPLLLVHYPNRLGFTNIPFMIVDFFNERKKVRIACEAAYKLVMNQTRPLEVPSSTKILNPSVSKDSDFSSSVSSVLPQETLRVAHDGDAIWDVDSEPEYGSSFEKLPKTIAKSRTKYYEELAPKLSLARALARNEREPTKDEINFPPKTEVELREQRMKKEKRWMEDESAWPWLRKGSGVVWDERFHAALRVFEQPSESVEEERRAEAEARSLRHQESD